MKIGRGNYKFKEGLRLTEFEIGVEYSCAELYKNLVVMGCQKMKNMMVAKNAERIARFLMELLEFSIFLAANF